MKYFPFLLAIGMLFLSCQNDDNTTGGQHKANAEQKLMIAVAANVQYVIKDLANLFEKKHGIVIETNISSSGKLTAQIQQGAPYDVFLSANMKYPQRLYDNGYAVNEPAVYALGALVLWTATGLPLEGAYAVLEESNFDKLAVANPKNAPYGEQAVRAMEFYQLQEKLEPKLVYGESIAQTNQYIISKACDLGITAKSVVLSPEIQGKGEWLEIPTEAYKPIQQGMVITKYGQQKHPKASNAFFTMVDCGVYLPYRSFFSNGICYTG